MFKPTSEYIRKETERWEVLHGPVPVLGAQPDGWRPGCEFTHLSAYEHPLAQEVGEEGSQRL